MAEPPLPSRSYVATVSTNVYNCMSLAWLTSFAGEVRYALYPRRPLKQEAAAEKIYGSSHVFRTGTAK